MAYPLVSVILCAMLVALMVYMACCRGGGGGGGGMTLCKSVCTCTDPAQALAPFDNNACYRAYIQPETNLLCFDDSAVLDKASCESYQAMSVFAAYQQNPKLRIFVMQDNTAVVRIVNLDACPQQAEGVDEEEEKKSQREQHEQEENAAEPEELLGEQKTPTPPANPKPAPPQKPKRPIPITCCPYREVPVGCGPVINGSAMMSAFP